MGINFTLSRRTFLWCSKRNCFVQLLSCVLFLATRGLQHTSLPCSSPSPRFCSNSCPLRLEASNYLISVALSFALDLSQHQGINNSFYYNKLIYMRTNHLLITCLMTCTMIKCFLRIPCHIGIHWSKNCDKEFNLLIEVRLELKGNLYIPNVPMPGYSLGSLRFLKTLNF